MAFREPLDGRNDDLAIGHSETIESDSILAYYAECKLCPCPKFVGGQNEAYCLGCGHSKDDHRY